MHVSILSLFFRNKELHRRTAALAAGWLSALYSVNGCQWQPAIHHLVTLQMKAEVLTLKSFASAPDVIAYQMTSIKIVELRTPAMLQRVWKLRSAGGAGHLRPDLVL